MPSTTASRPRRRGGQPASRRAAGWCWRRAASPTRWWSRWTTTEGDSPPAPRAEATGLSGRGVGLDAVKDAVEALGGKMMLRSAVGKGSQFVLELPLSVSMANLLLVQVGGELYGLPMARVVLTTEYDLSARGGEGFEARSLAVMGQLVRAYSLAKLFGLPSLAPPGPRPFAVLEVDGITFALSVDRLIGQEEAVLKPLFPPLDRIKGLAGTTVLGNGRPLLVLDPRGLPELAESAARLKGAA